LNSAEEKAGKQLAASSIKICRCEERSSPAATKQSCLEWGDYGQQEASLVAEIASLCSQRQWAV
jgi:hypothetical protein